MKNLEKNENINQLLEVRDVFDNGINKLKLIMFRHGPKKEAAGEKDELADYFLMQVKDGLDEIELDSPSYVHITSSPADRAKKTEEVAVEHMGTKENIKIKPDSKRLGTFENLSEKFKVELNNLIKYQKKLEERIKGDGENKDYDSQEAKQELKNKIDSVILENMFDGTLDNLRQDLNLDETLNLTTNDFSRGLESNTRGYLDHLGLLKSDTNNPVSLNITHSYPIMSFLKNNLKFIEGEQVKSAQDMQGREFMEKVGGCIAEADSISLDYIQKGSKKLIKVSGKDFEGYIDYE